MLEALVKGTGTCGKIDQVAHLVTDLQNTEEGRRFSRKVRADLASLWEAREELTRRGELGTANCQISAD